MDFFWILFFVLVLCFAFVLMFGAPYLPTAKKQSSLAIKILDIKKGETFFELGCGDGRVLLLAEKSGANVIGYELNPILFIIARITTFRKRKSIQVKFGNFWKADLSKADAVYVFLLDKYMKKLDEKLKSEVASGTRLASYAFKIPGRKVVSAQEPIFLYRY